MSPEIPTVVTVSWETGGGSPAGHVDFGVDGQRDRCALAHEVEPGRLEAVLVGLPAGAEVTLQATESGDGGARIGQVITVVTGPIPSWVPTVHADGDHWDDDRVTSGFLVTSFVPGPAAILDRDGRVVWWHQLEVDYAHSITRAVPSPDGDGIWYLLWTNLHHGGPENSMRQLVKVSFDGTRVDTLTVSGAHHDFTLRPDGGVAMLMYDAREVEGIVIAADRLVEVDPDGSTRQLWTVWDHVEYDPDVEYEGGERWGHCNAVDHDPVDDAYFVSCRNFSQIFKIDRTSGDVLWRLGPDGDFELTGGTWFENEHQFAIDGDRALVFDNAIPTEATSAAREYTFDEAGETAVEVWNHEPDPGLGVFAFGDVARLPTGNTLITWGSSGRIDEVDPEGGAVRRLEVGLGAGVGYTTWVEELTAVP